MFLLVKLTAAAALEYSMCVLSGGKKNGECGQTTSLFREDWNSAQCVICLYTLKDILMKKCQQLWTDGLICSGDDLSTN